MICKPYKCIFVHIPKAAGRSVELYFLNKLGMSRDNESDRRALLLTDNNDPAKGTEKLSHLSASEYVACGHVTAQDFSQYYKFSFVRNPWSRLVSEYRYRNFISHKSFKHFVLNKLPKPGWDDKYRHVMPQSEMLCDADGELLVDFVGKFERINEDFETVCKHFGFEDDSLPHVNSSSKKSRELRRKLKNVIHRNQETALSNYVEFYDDETRQFVHQLYRSDIELFGYSFEDGLKNQKTQTEGMRSQ